MAEDKDKEPAEAENPEELSEEELEHLAGGAMNLRRANTYDPG
jgi:hypothetical protein